MTAKKKPASLALRRWRVVWCIEHEHGRTNGTDFVEAVDANAAGLAVAVVHPRCVIAYIAPDTRDPAP